MMSKRRGWIVFVALITAFATLLCSCASSSANVKSGDEKLHELADVLGKDLREKILPNKEHPDVLSESEYQYVVSKKNYSLGTDTLAIFYAEYKDKKDCEITIIFIDGSFVVSRIVFIENKSYYLRYEYDTLNPDSLSVRGQVITDVTLKHQKSSSKWILTLNDGKKQRAQFSFIDLQDL